MSVLVIAEECDPTADAVVEALGVGQVHRVDLGWFPSCMSLDADLGEQGWVGALHTQRRDILLAGLQSVFYRSPTMFEFPPDLSGAELRHAQMEAKIALGGCLSDLPGVLWVNHPARQADMTKPIQLTSARTAGLAVPRTRITSNADAVRRFAREVDGPIVVKPLGFASVLEEGARAALYTHVLTDAELADLRGVETTAHLFQAYIADKAYELRLTVVGSGEDSRLFPAAIHAGSPESRVDFRADYRSLTYSVVDVPPEVEKGTRAFMRKSGIELGHFDFCVDNAGRHWFLECNGSGGQYQFIEAATGLRISDAIADLLRTGTPWQ